MLNPKLEYVLFLLFILYTGYVACIIFKRRSKIGGLEFICWVLLMGLYIFILGSLLK